MNNFRKSAAVLFAFLFVITAILSLFLFNLDRRAFNAETYQEALANENFYNQIPILLAESMINSANLQSMPLTMRGMSTEAWEDFFRTLLPQDALKNMGDSTINSMFAYLNMQTNSVRLSLLPIKANMVTDSGVQAVFNLLKTQPDCTLSQIAEMTFSLLTSQEIAFCNPPPELAPLVTPIIQVQLQTATLIIPDEITILSAEGLAPQDDSRYSLKFARTLMKLSPLLPLGFLLLLTVTIVRSLRSWLGWWGVSFIPTGFIAIILGLAGAPVISFILKGIIIQRASSSLPPIFANYGSELASAMVNALLMPILWQGLIIFLAGLGMAGVAYLLKFAKFGK
jgi:hypothetical protein